MKRNHSIKWHVPEAQWIAESVGLAVERGKVAALSRRDGRNLGWESYMLSGLGIL